MIQIKATNVLQIDIPSVLKSIKTDEIFKPQEAELKGEHINSLKLAINFYYFKLKNYIYNLLI
jgi:hypothetical protein